MITKTFATKAGRPELDKEYYAGAAYEKAMYSSAINYLDARARERILFTNGDNDNYPLLYAQRQPGRRIKPR